MTKTGTDGSPRDGKGLSLVLDWLKRLTLNEKTRASTTMAAAVPKGRGMSEAYFSLHDYLVQRYSSVVVLTFAQMEDLLGSPLPAPARLDKAWWNGNDQRNFEHSNSWRLAKRSAVVNLVSKTVTFERD